MSETNQSAAELMSIASVCAALEVGTRTVWRWISVGTFPPPDLRVNGKIVRWKRSTVEAWIERNAAATAGAA